MNYRDMKFDLAKMAYPRILDAMEKDHEFAFKVFAACDTEGYDSANDLARKKAHRVISALSAIDGILRPINELLTSVSKDDLGIVFRIISQVCDYLSITGNDEREMMSALCLDEMIKDIEHHRLRRDENDLEEEK